MTFALSRRQFAIGATGLVASPFLVGPARAAGSVVAATFPGTWEDAYRSIVAPIAAQSGVDVTIAPALAQDQVAKMMASPDSPPYDALLVSPGQTAVLKDAGLIAEIDPSKLKNWDLLIDSAKTAYGPNVTIEVNGIAYNPDVVPEPKGYADLFENPVYDGQVAWIGFGSNTATMAWVEIAKIYGGGADNMQPVFDLLAEHLPKIGAIATSGNNQMTMYQQGEIAVFMASTGNVAKLRSLGLPCNFAHPETGSPAVPVTIHMAAGASDPDAVYAYMDAAISTAAQSQLAVPPTGYIPTNKDVPLTDIILEFVSPEQLAAVVLSGLGDDWPAPCRMDGRVRPRRRALTTNVEGEQHLALHRSIFRRTDARNDGAVLLDTSPCARHGQRHRARWRAVAGQLPNVPLRPVCRRGAG